MGCRLDVRCSTCDGCVCLTPEEPKVREGEPHCGYCGLPVRPVRREAFGLEDKEGT